MGKKITRRVFIERLAGGVAIAGATGIGLGWLSRNKTAPDRLSAGQTGHPVAVVAGNLDLDDVPVKNPAYLKLQTRKGPILATHTRDGRTIRLRLESESEFVWDCILNVKEYHEGKRLTVQQLLETVARRYGDRPVEGLRKECFAFLQNALQENIILTPRSYVVSNVNAV